MKPNTSLQKKQIETAVIGGGMAGLACSRQLHDAGKEFVLITDNLDGRVHHSKRGVYFGAVIMTRDYTNIQRYVSMERLFLERTKGCKCRISDRL